MRKEKKLMILERLCYLVIFFLVVSIVLVLFKKNEDRIAKYINDKDKNIEDINYSESFSIESLKDESLKRSVRENDNELAILVNKITPISEGFKAKLVEPNIPLVGAKGDEKNLINVEMQKDLERMFNDAKKDGIVDMLLNSAYRSYENQKNIYSGEINNTKNATSNLVAKPGESEHQTGLAIDLTTASINFDIGESFENTDAFKWLSKNAHKYGFILRYPKDKTDITKYVYEPWHYRYVGDKELSTYIYENQLTLEEVYAD